MARNGQMTPAFSWALATVVAGAVVVVAVVAILPKGSDPQLLPQPVAAPLQEQPLQEQAASSTETAAVAPAPTEPKIETPPAEPVVAKPEPAPEPAPPVVAVAEETAPPTEDPAEADAIAALELPALETPAEAVVAPELEPEPEPTPEPALPDPVTPSFDTVRVEPDGAALVAGRADPGARVALEVEGKPLAEVTADAAGNFVAMFDLPTDAQPRLMSIKTTDGAGREMRSTDSVAIAPISAPVVDIPVAEAAAAVEEPPEAPAALMVSPEGATIAQAETPVSPVTIDTFSFDATGSAQLSGRGAQGATVRLYLDNAEMALVQVGDSGVWQADLAAVEPGSYLLRADQMAADGKVLARVEQEVTREATVDPPAEPVAVAVAEPAATAPTPTAPEPEAATTPETAPPAPLTVVVKPGYSLWRIANEQMGDGVMYVQVFEANKDQIRDPDLIYPGQVFTIPAP
jgi:hypothetical protein